MKDIFTRKRRDIMTARDESDIMEILHWHRPLAADIVKLIRSEIQDIYTNSDDIFDAYENFLIEQKKFGCLSEAAKNKIVSFSSVKGKNHIWISYREVAQKILFPQNNSGGLKSLLKLYRRTLFQDEQQKSIASLIWNADNACAELEQKLLTRYNEVMHMPKKFQGFLNPEEAYSEHSYLLLIRRGSRFGEIDKEFLSTYEDFVCNEARDILIGELENHIEKLKNIS